MFRFWMVGAILAVVLSASTRAQMFVGPPKGGVAPKGGMPPSPPPAIVGQPKGGVPPRGSTPPALRIPNPASTVTVNRGAYYPYPLFRAPPIFSLYPNPLPGAWFVPPTFFGPPGVSIVFQPIFVPQPVIVPVRAEELADLSKVPDLDRFKIIRPDRPMDPAVPPARVEKKPKEVDLGIKPAELPLAAPRAANPSIEAERQIDLGKGAFSEGQYGRAVEHFRRATVIAPDESAAYFLLAQARFAIGKYDEAVTSIADGLKRQPDWPASRFSSRDLYRANPAIYDAHLLNLRTALEANSDDPRLMFLLGVQLWFDGQRDAVKPLFARSVKLAKDPSPVEAFIGK
jgi:hypothetical protein